MLNASAKAFVPGGASSGGGATGASSLSVASKPFVPSTFTAAPPSWFRYQWDVGTRPTKVAVSSNAEVSVPTLFAKGQLRPASSGGNAPGALQQFFRDHFEKPMNTGSAFGIVISRVKVAPELVGAPFLELGGYVIAVEAPTLITPPTDSTPGGTVGVNEFVSATWEECFNAYGTDHRVQAMAHVTYAMGPAQHHFIVLSCTDKAKQIEVLAQSAIQERVSARRISEVRRAMYFGLAPAFVAAAVVLVGFRDADAVRQQSQTLGELLGDAQPINVRSCTMDGLRELESQVAAARDAVLSNEKTRGVIPIFLEVSEASAGLLPMSHATFIAATLRLLQEFGVPVVKLIGHREVATAAAKPGGTSQSGPAKLWRYASRDYNAVVADTLTESNTAFVVGSMVPPQAHVGDGAAIPMATFCDSLGDLSEVAELLKPIWARAQRRFLSADSLLSRSKLGTKAIPYGDVRVCRRARGTRIFLVTDRSDGKFGRIFAFCPKTGSTLSLPTCWSNPNFGCSRCVLAATVAPSTFFEGQVRLIVDDVLMFSGNVVVDQPFSARWHHLDAAVPNQLEDENSWAYPSPFGVVILRAAFAPAHQCRHLVATPHADHASSGVTIVGWDSPGASEKLLWWIPGEAVACRFRALRVEELVLDKPERENSGAPPSPPRLHEIRRVYLGAAVAGADAPYNDEYADFLAAAAPSLKQGDIVECMLRRAPDGAHWWEVVHGQLGERDVSSADRHEYVQLLVNDPPVLLEELLTVLPTSKQHS